MGRSEEVERIAEALRPLTRRRTPENLLVHGSAGTGKTTCVEHVFDKLGDETSVKPMWINCWQYNTRSSLLTELLIKLGYPAPRKGKPVDELLSKIREWLNKNRGAAVALDEFDQLDDKTEVIYDLHMLNQKAENKIGTVMICNRDPEEVEMDQRSRSRLNCQTLEFSSYTAEQLIDILEKRVERAFKPSSVSDGVIERIAERVAEKSGDCRKALETLLRAGRKATQSGNSKIDTEDLRDLTT